MTIIEDITPEQITAMNYNELIGIVKETNRAPGGIKTLHTVCREGKINRDSHVLEIGTSTGFTAIEISRMTGARVTAIDINASSLEEATRRASMVNVGNRIDFRLDDATNLSFGDEKFDMVFCGNVTSYVPDREKALSEYGRVLKDGGILTAIPMYYLKKPEQSLIERVSKAMGFSFTPEYKTYWDSFFGRKPFEKQWSENYRFDHISKQRVEDFVAEILSSDHLKGMRPDTLRTLRDKYSSNIHLFAENLSHMGYTIMILGKKSFTFDSELFTGSLIRGAENVESE